MKPGKSYTDMLAHKDAKLQEQANNLKMLENKLEISRLRTEFSNTTPRRRSASVLSRATHTHVRSRTAQRPYTDS